MNRIKELLEQQGLSQKALAIELGVQQSLVNRWCTGIRTPSKENIVKLSDYFGVSADYLLGVSDEQTRLPAKAHITDEDVKFALWGDQSREITQAQFDEVKRFAEFIVRKKK